MRYWKLKILFNCVSELIGLRCRFIFYYEGKTPGDYKDEFIDLELINIKFARQGYLIKNQEVIIYK